MNDFVPDDSNLEATDSSQDINNLEIDKDEVEEDETSDEEIDTTEDEEVGEEGEADPKEVETVKPQNTEDVKAEPTDLLTRLESLDIDPELKQELKSGYLRQSDYTRKTQEVAQRKSDLDTFDRLNPVISKMLADPKLVDYVMSGGVLPEQSNVNNDEFDIPEDPKEFLKLAEDRAYQRAIKVIEQKESERFERELIAKRETEINIDISNSQQVDPRLSDDSGEDDFKRVVSSLVSVDQGVRNGTKTYTQATKDAIESFDKFMSRKLSSEKEKLSVSARLKRTKNTSPSSLPTGQLRSSEKPKSMMDAYKLTLKSDEV